MIKNKNNEPRSGCSMLIVCGSIVMILTIIYFIVFMTALSGYMNEITARSLGDQREFTEYFQTLIDKIFNEMSELNMDYLYIMSYAACIIVIFIIFKLIYKRPISQLGISSENWINRLGLGLLTGMAAITLYVLISLILGIASLSGYDFQYLYSSDFLTSFIFFVGAGFFEEILFRGFFMTVLKTTRKKVLIFTLPAVIFASMHLGNPNVNLLGLINILLIGFAFAYMFVKTGSLWMPAGYHISWNFFQGNIFGIEVSGTEHMSLMKYSASGSDILTGGAFGAEGGLICTAVHLGLLAFIHYAIKTDETAQWTLDSDLPFTAAKIH